ncbi:FAD-dependent oxidoreductase [Rhodococcus sp. IEGM 1354]|uniref:FAD-dependent oxidoreductase n=1 Tax=Rhodococcus sp. IEGM 1354 TaxID=3047088 RepID=UPI0024B835F5|nr:FAD-dependent oxidoreductase [Rhodococcus sp. IEGM 1354]MDI9933160.1 FAD-dependent oxidoreductase [Rhodococcus sp. IEGM 1354]
MALNSQPDKQWSQPATTIEKVRASGKLVVVGFGYMSAVFTCKVLADQRLHRYPLEILVVHDGLDVASDLSGGFLMPFLSSDTKNPDRATQSFHDTEFLDDAGLSHYRDPLQTLFVSQEEQVYVPPGHPGRATIIDPSDYGLPAYSLGAHLDEGGVLSMCALMPRLRAYIAAHASVRVLRRTVHSIFDVTELAADFGATTVCIAAGARARFLLNRDIPYGDLGVLLRGSYDDLSEIHKRFVIMDEDSEARLAYMIPHRECRHALFGGTTGTLLTEESDWIALREGQIDLRRAPGYARDAMRDIRERILDQMPVLAPALPKNYEPGTYAFGIRPRAARVIVERLTYDLTHGLDVVHINGLGGSGITIAPAVAQEALDYHLLDEEDEGDGDEKARKESSS